MVWTTVVFGLRRRGRRVRRERPTSLAMRVGSRRREVRDSEGGRVDEVEAASVRGKEGWSGRMVVGLVREVLRGEEEIRMRMDPI